MKRDVQFARSLRDHATAYYELGFNVTSIVTVGKGPYHRWKEYMYKPQARHEVLNRPWHRLVGIGSITGINKLFCMDFDKCALSEIPTFLNAFGLPQNYPWVVISGSGNGFHIWFSSDFNLSTADKKVVTYIPKSGGLFKQIELRLNAHVVMPPSLHSSGNQYRFWAFNDLKNSPLNID